jgi:RND family efflux transporter MFP subunit
MWVVAVSITGVIMLVILLVTGLLPRVHTNKELAADAQAAMNAPVPVNVVTARRSDATINVMLPGTLRPWQEVSIFARSPGYLKKFYVDISNQVKKDQLMADIATPELDQQLLASKATLKLQQAAAAKAQTDLDFAQKTNDRYQSLKGTSGVTQLELDQFQANFNSALAVLNQARAQVGVAEANVQQLTEMQSFEKIVAPFSGVVTGRAYDVGAYIIANPTAVDVTPMFKLAENDVLRAFVNVPQNYSLTIQKGMKVTITARERAGRKFTGEVLGTTNYLDPMARSLLTEIRIENPDFAILPGMYVQAEFHVTRDHPPLIISAPALVINAEGNFVGIVKDNKVHFIPVTLGVDFGNDIEILSGLTGDEQIIGNPGEKTVEGAEVQIAGDKKAPQPG